MRAITGMAIVAAIIATTMPHGEALWLVTCLMATGLAGVDMVTEKRRQK
jgi:hypothetical protein